MAIQMRRGQLANYDKSKMLPGEWGISIDNDSDNQKAFISFAPGVSKEVMMVEDAEEQIAVATAEAIDMATEEAEAWAHGNSFHVNDYASGDGSTKLFTLAETPSSILGVYVDGSSVSAYTLSGKTITFTTAPASGSNNIRVYYTVNTTTDNAKYYAEQAEAVAESIPEDYSDLSDDVNQLKNALIVNNASGSIASFPDGGDGFPVRDLKVQMEPIQDLHGYDHPWPAGGGKNLTPYDTPLNVSAGASVQPVLFSINLDSGVAYTFSCMQSVSIPTSERNTLIIRDPNGGNHYEAAVINYNPTSLRHVYTYTPTVSGSHEVRMWVNTSSVAVTYTEWQVEKSSAFTSYAPYSNVCPISGRDSVTVTRTGVNIWDEEWEVGTITPSTGQNETDSTRIRSKGYIPVLPSTKYRLVCSANDGRCSYYDINKQIITSNALMFVRKEFTTPDNCYYVRFSPVSTYGATYNHDISINYPSTDTDYHAYQGQSIEIQLGQTVYAGTLDVTDGVLTVDRAIVDLGTLNWVYLEGSFNEFSSSIPDIQVNNAYAPNMICSKYPTVAWHPLSGVDKVIYKPNNTAIYVMDSTYTDAATFKAAMDGVQLCYELATPVTVTLTAQQMTTLLGQNNVWSDADSVSVDYVADTKLYIEQLTEPDADMVADMNITSGKYFMVGNTLYLATANIANGAAITVGVNCTRTSLAEALNAINS